MEDQRRYTVTHFHMSTWTSIKHILDLMQKTPCSPCTPYLRWFDVDELRAFTLKKWHKDKDTYYKFSFSPFLTSEKMKLLLLFYIYNDYSGPLCCHIIFHLFISISSLRVITIACCWQLKCSVGPLTSGQDPNCSIYVVSHGVVFKSSHLIFHFFERGRGETKWKHSLSHSIIPLSCVLHH